MSGNTDNVAHERVGVFKYTGIYFLQRIFYGIAFVIKGYDISGIYMPVIKSGVFLKIPVN